MQHWFQSLPFQQFQVLFNSLFKVLCIFRSRYLFAIGLAPVFSFRRNLPPTLSCSPKQLDSLNGQRTARTPSHVQVCHLLWKPFSKGLKPGPCLPTPSIDYNSGQRPDFQFELFRVQSPLLAESLLVSFPPLNYMLKSRGSSCLISGPMFKSLDC